MICVSAVRLPLRGITPNCLAVYTFALAFMWFATKPPCNQCPCCTAGHQTDTTPKFTYLANSSPCHAIVRTIHSLSHAPHTLHTHTYTYTHLHPTSTSTSTSAISTHSFVAFHLISLIDVFAYPNGAIVLLQLLWPARVSRVLQMPRGNMLMVGMGGSGRRSSCRLAASIADCRLMTIQVTKTYSQTDWRDDLKKILMTASFNLNHTVFLFTDAQVSRNEKLIKYKWKFANICIPFESENMQNHKKIEFSGFKMNACVCVSA